MGVKIDSDVLLCGMSLFCERCYRETNGYRFDPPVTDGCHNDLCPMKFVANEIVKMQSEARLVETINKTVCVAVSINNQNGTISTNSNNEQRTSSKRRCPNCGSHWLSAEYCCNCGARTVEDDI